MIISGEQRKLLLDYWKTEYRGIMDILLNSKEKFVSSIKLYFTILTLPITLFITLIKIFADPESIKLKQ